MRQEIKYNGNLNFQELEPGVVLHWRYSKLNNKFTNCWDFT